MTKADVIQMIESYRNDAARCGHLEVEIAQQGEYLRQAMANRAEDAAGPQAQQITGMPHGTGVSNPTERIGVALASGYLPDYVRNIEAKLDALKREYDSIRYNVQYVQSWLSGLLDNERFIIQHQMIDRWPWPNVVEAYNAQFGIPLSKDTLRRVKARALNSIFRAAHVYTEDGK